jgi:hypothetical protein
MRVSWGESLLLRRITKHVHDQNWFAVGIDFFIVVFGVFLGIQVANWNENRTEDCREQLYLERLDLEFDVVENRINRAILAAENGQNAVDQLIKALSVGPDAFPTPQGKGPGELFWESITNVRPATPPAAFKELVASGELSLLKNQTLRAVLYEFDAISDVSLTVHERGLNDMAGLRQLIFTAYLLEAEGVRENFNWSPERFRTGAQRISGVFISEAFFDNPDFLNELNGALVYITNNEVLARQQRQLIEQINALLLEELSR